MNTPNSCTPQSVNRRATVIAIALCVIGIVTFALAGLVPSGMGAIQLTGLVLIVAGIYIASKFLFVSYTYSITEPNASGQRFFLIEQAQGKRSSLICRINLLRITAVEDIDPKAPSIKEKYFTYVASMGGGRYQMLTARGDKEPVRVKIEASSEFITALREAVAAIQPSSDDTAE